MNFVSEPSARIPDFGLKNVALIVSVAAVLGLLAWNQKPLHFAAVQNEQIKVASNAQVLGANTVDPKILEQFQSIEVLTSTDNSQQAFINYASQVNIVAQNDLLSDLLKDSQNSSGQVKAQITTRQNKLITDLAKIAVPSDLADYHRLTLGYYSLAFLNAQGQLSQDGQTVLPVIADQLDKMRTGFRVSAGVDIP